jgi:hypothetical protein
LFFTLDTFTELFSSPQPSNAIPAVSPPTDTAEPTDTDSYQQTLTDISGTLTDNIALERYAQRISDVIKSATKISYERTNEKPSWDAFCLQRASSHLRDAQLGRNILTEAFLETHFDTLKSEWRLRLYRVFTHWIWQYFIHFVVIIHVGFAFWESTERGDGIKVGVPGTRRLAEAAILFFEISDAAMRVVIAFGWNVAFFFCF